MGTIGGHPVEPGRRVIGTVNGEPVYAPLQAADIGAVTDADVTAAIAGKLDANTPITPATKTKITYDADGLVTAGADATTADIADSANKRYVTDAQQVVIGNTSGTNTGDQTSVSGNAGTATALQTARTINGVSFDGTANIQNTLASANFANQGTATTVLHGNAAGNPAFGAVTEADQTLADNTTNDVSTTKHGYAPKAPNDATKFLNGVGAYTVPAAPAGAELWDVVATLAADFTVTNALLQDVTGFTGAITAGLVYEVEVIGAASANDATGAIAAALATTGTWTAAYGWTEGVTFGSGGGSTPNNVVPVTLASTTLSTASPGLKLAPGDNASRPFRLRYFFTCATGGNAKLQMGNQSAGAGRTSTLKTGTTFRLRRVG